MNIYLPPSFTIFKPRRVKSSTWINHLPFAFDLVAALRPQTLVELGVYKGLSYFTFCQAMQELHIQGRCYGVDTWEGDEHVGPYEESVFDEVSAHNSEFYATFSTLLRMRFAEALPRFQNESVDLIHIDGFHTYEAVKEDFNSWYPKLAPGGILIFHDIRARLLDMGVWRFWDEISREYPSFAFEQGFGLGLIFKPDQGAPLPDHPLLQEMFGGSADSAHALRRFYVHAARLYDFKRRNNVSNSNPARPPDTAVSTSPSCH